MARSAKQIIAGFALLLALMAALMAVGLSHIASTNRHLQAVVAKYNTRLDLALEMRESARDRLILLHALAITDDLFERDRLERRFQDYANRFIAARERLLAMRLTPVERQTMERQMEYSRVSASLQDRFLHLITAGRTAEANRLFLTELMPAQDRVMRQLDRMLALQRDAAHEAVTDAMRSYHTAVTLMATLGAAGVLLGIGIAVYVTRTVSRAAEDLFREKELAEVTLHSIADAVITADRQGLVDYMNPIAEKLTGWFAHEARGHGLTEVFRVVQETTREKIALDADARDTAGGHESMLLLSRDNQEFAVETSVAPIRNRASAVIGSVIVFRDVTKSRFLSQQLVWQASHDALTGLANRAEFQRRLAQLLDSAHTQGKHHALLYLDLDQFKVVNDTCGHGIGDELLRRLASILEAKIRKGDTLARLGGDEFGVLLENCPLSQAQRIADGLREAVHQFRFAWMDRVFEIGVSIGVTAIDAGSASPAAVLSAADAACYAAKDAGRNRVHLCRDDDVEVSRRQGEMRWLSRINAALEAGRLRLRAQRIESLEPGGIARFEEVLLDMVDESGEVVPAHAFIPAAERYGLMPAVDRYVVRRLFELKAERWRGEYRDCYEIGAPCDYLCSINLSGSSINDERFMDYLFHQIAEYQVPPRMLCFEITETAAINNLERAAQFMRELSNIGCRFALDDFGNGMSSFAYLKHLPVDFLKIDGAFVKDMAHDSVDFAMVEAINRIGHIMEMKTIAEFVETPAILEKVRALGVNYAQGNGLYVAELLGGEGDTRYKAQETKQPT